MNPQTSLNIIISRKKPFSKQLFEGEYLKKTQTAWYKSGFQLGFDEGLVELALGLVGAVAVQAGWSANFRRLDSHVGRYARSVAAAIQIRRN